MWLMLELGWLRGWAHKICWPACLHGVFPCSLGLSQHDSWVPGKVSWNETADSWLFQEINANTADFWPSLTQHHFQQVLLFTGESWRPAQLQKECPETLTLDGTDPRLHCWRICGHTTLLQLYIVAALHCCSSSWRIKCVTPRKADDGIWNTN